MLRLKTLQAAEICGHNGWNSGDKGFPRRHFAIFKGRSPHYCPRRLRKFSHGVGDSPAH
jgi:hypothetical protein